MTDHYAEAVRLLKEVKADNARYALAQAEGRTFLANEIASLNTSWSQGLAAAQVHATLATVQRPVAPGKGGSHIAIPWPPSEELIERCRANVAAILDNGDQFRSVSYVATRAVLDELGGAVVGDE